MTKITRMEVILDEKTFAPLLHVEMTLPISLENLQDMKTLGKVELDAFYLGVGKSINEEIIKHRKQITNSLNQPKGN